MNHWVYVIMLFMFLIVSSITYIITKLLLSILYKKVVYKKEIDLFEKIYKETMKEL